MDAGAPQAPSSTPLPVEAPAPEAIAPPVSADPPVLEADLGAFAEEFGEGFDVEESEPEEAELEPEPEIELGLDLRDAFEEEPAPGEKLFKPDTRSLRAKRSIAVRAEPRQDAASLGTLAQDMRVRWKQAVKGPGCTAWVEIEPRGWICERYLESNWREPRTRELPLLSSEELTPGVYAHVSRRARVYESLAEIRRRPRGRRVKGSVTVKLVSEVRRGRRHFWRTSDGKYIDARFLRPYTPSAFGGLDRVALEALPPLVAWAQSRATPREPVEVRAAPGAASETVGVLAPRTVVALQEFSGDGQWARLAPEQWVAVENLHRLRAAPALPDLLPEERWLDVDLTEQVLVAYEGVKPVYATLISSGKPLHETPTGIFRIWLKSSEADMTGAEGRSRYRVATVPWTMFFQGNFALHTAYWHDRWGEPVSHGCINLSPRDARALYRWSGPEVPLGWSMAYGTADFLGSRIRVRQGLEPTGEVPLPVAVSTVPLP
ncbi:L,D-transpeptidase family protein [Stigmatella aurantiaca]|uniref:ErfK/YbiS/YcfS/YnhG family protein n=1 Tax=Stigmatella aurantiaca (strain DW4/3-1) TaxID=378806 RepID=E3FEF6_STIAD|nr:L,D-transpeptidase family protein [Stigmatella aurantiaca]ADO75112.1 ErfK/YbiS/YcfS/YnhG family protein [Stigmatella aurantiaca DW4/3-1]